MSPQAAGRPGRREVNQTAVAWGPAFGRGGIPAAIAASLGLAWAGLTAGGAAAQTAPTPGAVLQQTAPAPAAIPVPAAPITLPGRKAGRTGATMPIPVRRLKITGNHLIPTNRLHALVAPAEGRTLTLDQLNAVVHRITAAYRAAGYPLAYAFLPAQIVRQGVIRIDVVEPRYDRIEVTGAARFSKARTRAALGLKPGDPVASGPLERGLLLLQQTPGVIVNGVLMPGAAPGTTSLRVTRRDAPLLSGRVTLTNHGNAYTGRGLAGLAVTAADPFGLGGALSAQGTLSQGADLASAGVDALSPDLGGWLRLDLYGSRTRYRLGGAFAGLDQRGTARQLGVGLSYPLQLAPGRRLDVRVDLIDNRLEQVTGATGTVNRQHLNLARFALSGARRAGASGEISGRIALNLGRLALGPAAARAADAAGPQTAGGFAVLRLQMARRQALPGGLELNASLSGQLASRNLDSSQKFYIGGPDGVMSTDPGDGGGDEGLLLRLRLSRALATALPGRLRLSGLAQWGMVRVNHRPYAGAAGPQRLSAGALGLGLRYKAGPWSLDAGAAAPLGGGGLQTGGRLWLSAGASF